MERVNEKEKSAVPRSDPTAATHAAAAHCPLFDDDEQRLGTDAKALELLVCPLTKTTLEYDSQRQELISRRANLAYPIRSGVPLLTREAARNLDDPVSIEPSKAR